MANKGKKPSTLITEHLAKAKKKETESAKFNSDLLETLVSCDIAAHKFGMEKMKWFLKKYCVNQTVPSVTTLRRGMADLAVGKIMKIREIIGDSDVYFQIDETADKRSRNVVNIIVGKLNDAVSKPMLLHVAFQKNTNSSSIQNVILDCCKLLWPGDNRYSKLVLLLSDQAAYMVNAGKKLKEMTLIFPRLNHVTCIAHAINLVCQSIAKDFYLVNKFFGLQKTWFKNSNKRKNEYQAQTKLTLIPSPITIRWGTWLKCANYHRLNFQKVKDFFLGISLTNEPESLKKMKKILSGKKIESDIIRLTASYGQIPAIIAQLEGSDLTMKKQLELLESVEDLIKGTSHHQMLISSLKKNTDFKKFTSDEVAFDDRVKRSFAPLTTCNVERSFSIYRAVFRDNRTRLKTSSLHDIMIVNYNNFL